MNADEMLPHYPPIVENIFKHLCARDLNSCAQVCKMWNSLSKTENKRRLFMEWFLQHGDKKYFREMFSRLPSSKYLFQEYMLGARTRAATCFCLVTDRLMDTIITDTIPPFKKTKMGKYEKDRHRLRTIADNYLKPCLPSECQLFCISSVGIIGTHGNQTPVEVEVGTAIAGILIPYFPGVEIHHVTLEENTAAPQVHIKCLLMFVGNFQEHIFPFVNKCATNQSERFALGGALITSPMIGLGSCFVLTGENVEAASILIDHTVKDVVAELRCFEQTGLLRNQCFCFAFICVEKGIKKYKTSNYESDLFRKIFPNVPLLGVFGYGEIGAYHLPNGEGEVHQQRTKKFSYKKCLRSHSTTFVLVSVKNTN